MSNEVYFEKYQKRGAYHWEAISNSIRWHNAFVAERYAAVVRAAQPLQDKRVLDLGCGDGALSFLLQKHGARVVGLDIDMTGLQLARQELTRQMANANLVLGAGYELPFAANSFDRVVCSDVIEHVQSPHRLLQEIERVLNGMGKIVLTTPCRVSEHPLDPLHVKEFFPDELRALLETVFPEVNIRLSHPVAITEFYTLCPRFIGRRPFRFVINVLSVLGCNLYRASGFRFYGLIVATGVKMRGRPETSAGNTGWRMGVAGDQRETQTGKH